MNLFKRRSTQQDIHLVVDVGNGSVASGLIYHSGNGPAQIIYSKRIPLGISADQQGDRLASAVLSALEECISATAKEGPALMKELKLPTQKVSHVFCILSAPWYVSKTKVLTIENDQPISITKGFIDSLLEKEEGIFKQEIVDRSGTIGTPSTRNDLERVECRIIQAKLNGYTAINPYQKKARHIELAIFISLASKGMMRSIDRIVGSYFHADRTGFYSFSLVGHSVVRDIFTNESTFIFADVSAEVTDVSSIENQVLMESASFPVGRNYFISKLVDAFSVSHEIAFSMLNMYASGHAAPESAEKIELVCKKAMKEWGSYFFHSVSDIAQGGTLSKIFLTVDEEVAPLFIQAIKEHVTIDDAQQTSLENTHVILLDAEKLSQFISYAPHTQKDPFIALEGIFCTRLSIENSE